MSENEKQTYANHIRHDKAIYVYIFLLLAALLGAAAGIFMDNLAVVAAALIVNSLGCVLMAGNTRGYATKLQDRIIRLEMRLRLSELLGSEGAARVPDFQLKQLIALRFASDAELPELARKVLDENITDLKQIKEMIRDWQADFLRV